MITIRQLEEHEWQEYKAIRLEALQQEPTAFASSYSESITLPDAVWQEQLQQALRNENRVMYFAFNNERIIGMTGAFAEERQKINHIATIFGVYVQREFRGQGIGRKLMNATIDYVSALPHIEKIKLFVVADNIPALTMYQQLGFDICGTYKKELKVNGIYYDEFCMEKFIST